MNIPRALAQLKHQACIGYFMLLCRLDTRLGRNDYAGPILFGLDRQDRVQDGLGGALLVNEWRPIDAAMMRYLQEVERLRQMRLGALQRHVR